MTSEIKIHGAAPSQSEALATIHVAAFGPAAWNVEQIKSSLALSTTRGWVAFRASKPIGFILCQMGTDQAEILTFAVHPAAQRQGIGERLANDVIRAATESGTATMFLEVAADNEPARQLYTKLGFHPAGSRPGYYRRNGIAVDAVFYEKTLS